MGVSSEYVIIDLDLVESLHTLFVIGNIYLSSKGLKYKLLRRSDSQVWFQCVGGVKIFRKIVKATSFD